MWAIEELKQQCKKIHFFGLGFIQLKINEHLRLHFYTTKYSPIVEDAEVHDHRYDFTSKILLGSLNNSTWNYYSIQPDSKYTIHQVSCDPNKPIKEEPKSCLPVWTNRETYKKGDIYTMNWWQFHKIEAKEDTITLILRSDYRQEFAHVIREEGAKEVCPFSKQVPEEELWEIVEEMWKKV